MKKLFTLLTLSMALFAGGLMAQEKDDNTSGKTNTEAPAEPTDGTEDKSTLPAEETADLTAEETAEAAADKAKAEAWLEGKDLADEYSGLEDDDPRAAYAIDAFNHSGDTAWMIVAAAIVLMMTIPGLSLFYAGLARRKNVLSVLVQCFAITCLMTLLWTIYGYSLAYTEGNNYIGGLDKLFLKGIGVETIDGTIPESVFCMFQMTFAIITPALIVGAFAERMKFSAVMIFMAIWFTISYLPVWHMVWGGGLISGWGAIDFAGGTVVHINAGVAALVICMVLGARKGFGKENMTPHNVPFVLIGAALLWVGWFGFNAGSELAANGAAGMAQLVTQVATATAAFTWMLVEWCVKGKPTAVGIATGAVAGLVAITPASGSVGPMGAILIGVAAGAICYWAATSLKKSLGYDDSFDVFGVHGIGGIVGALLTGCLVIGDGGAESFKVDGQLWIQAKSIIVTIIWSGVAAYVAIRIADACCGGIRSSEDDETEGLDVTDHGEGGYQL